MQHRALILAAAIAGCSDGYRDGTPVVETRRSPPDPGVDRGDGIDRGDGTTGSVVSFPRCTASAGCERGICLPDSVSSGFCAQPCGTVEEVEGIRTGDCLRGEQCAFMDKGLGICARPCTSNAECPSTPTPLRCELSKNTPGRFCVPRLTGGEEGSGGADR